MQKRDADGVAAVALQSEVSLSNTSDETKKGKKVRKNSEREKKKKSVNIGLSTSLLEAHLKLFGQSRTLRYYATPQVFSWGSLKFHLIEGKCASTKFPFTF